MNVCNFYPNVKRICKKQNKQIGEVEQEVGVSYGYFSRSMHKSISAKTLINTAMVLGVSIDELLSPQTNLDKFIEVFGFDPTQPSNSLLLANKDFWAAEYKELIKDLQ